LSAPRDQRLLLIEAAMTMADSPTAATYRPPTRQDLEPVDMAFASLEKIAGGQERSL
jgi:hypothetical protein